MGNIFIPAEKETLWSGFGIWRIWFQKILLIVKSALCYCDNTRVDLNVIAVAWICDTHPVRRRNLLSKAPTALQKKLPLTYLLSSTWCGTSQEKADRWLQRYHSVHKSVFLKRLLVWQDCRLFPVFVLILIVWPCSTACSKVAWRCGPSALPGLPCPLLTFLFPVTILSGPAKFPQTPLGRLEQSVPMGATLYN